MRWAVVVAVYGAAGVVWRTVTGRAWLDALAFVVLVAVVNVVAQWVASCAKRKATVGVDASAGRARWAQPE